MEKTKSQIEKEALAYLTKTSNHVFVTESGHLYKIVPFVSEVPIITLQSTSEKTAW